jgi:hypothetical protein
MPTQDGVRGDEAMAAQCSGQPPDEGGEHGPVCPVQRGLGLVRRSTATSCRRTRSSMSFVEDARPISRTSPSVCWKIRYSSRSDRDHAGELASINHCWSAACAAFWNPTGVVARPPGLSPFGDECCGISSKSWPSARPLMIVVALLDRESSGPSSPAGVCPASVDSIR